MISVIIELIKTGLGFFQKKQDEKVSTAQIESKKSFDVNETNREEIHRGFNWRNALGYVCVVILAYSYIIVPLLDYLGIVVFQLPLADIIKIIILLLTGN